MQGPAPDGLPENMLSTLLVRPVSSTGPLEAKSEHPESHVGMRTSGSSAVPPAPLVAPTEITVPPFGLMVPPDPPWPVLPVPLAPLVPP